MIDNKQPKLQRTPFPLLFITGITIGGLFALFVLYRAFFNLPITLGEVEHAPLSAERTATPSPISNAEQIALPPLTIATQVATSLPAQPISPPSPEPVSPTALPASPTVVIPTPVVSPTPVPDISASDEPFPEQQIVTTLNNAGGTFGIIVYDLTDDTLLYSQQTALSFSAASLIKLPIATALYHVAQQGHIDLNEQITVQEEDKVGGTGSIQYDPPGTSYTLRDLSARMIYDSDNTAANVILQRIGGFDQVNQVMRDFGMSQTSVQRYLMDFNAINEGRDNVTSPADMLRLLQLLEQGTLVGADGSQEILQAMQQTTDRQKIPAQLPPDVVVMHKIGSLSAVEHDVGIVQIPTGRRYIIVMMSTGLPTNQAGIAALAEVSRIVFEYEQGKGL